MTTASKINIFMYDLMKGNHQLHAAGHVVKAMLVNTAITATWAVKADATEISAANGYPAGGSDIQNDIAQSTNVCNMTSVDIVYTASGGSFGPWRSFLLYNDTQTSPVKPLLMGWDYGSSNTTNTGETATLDFGATTFVLTG
jgi:hypothetical protein